MTSAERRPGDIILDHYCHGLTPEEREVARERLRAFARLIFEIGMRQKRAAMHNDDSCDRPGDDKIQNLHLRP